MFKIFPLNPPFSLGCNPIPFKGRRCSQIYPPTAISGPGIANKSRVAFSLQTLEGIFPNKRNKCLFGILMYSLSFLILYLYPDQYHVRLNQIANYLDMSQSLTVLIYIEVISFPTLEINLLWLHKNSYKPYLLQTSGGRCNKISLTLQYETTFFYFTRYYKINGDKER